MNFSPQQNLIGLTTALVLLLLIVITGSNVFLFLEINSLSEVLPGIVWENLTLLGDALVVSLIMLPFIRKRPDLVWTGLIAALIATLMVHTLKPLLDIQRPAAVLDNDTIQLIGPVYHYKSFPSGHAATVFALSAILSWYIKQRWIKTGIVILASLIGLSRIAVGVHWPADILAGAAIGYFAAIAGRFFVNLFKWKENKIAQLIVGFILIIAAIYLLLFYNSRYPNTALLQYFFAIVILVIGVREYYLIIKN